MEDTKDSLTLNTSEPSENRDPRNGMNLRNKNYSAHKEPHSKSMSDYTFDARNNLTNQLYETDQSAIQTSANRVS